MLRGQRGGAAQSCGCHPWRCPGPRRGRGQTEPGGGQPTARVRLHDHRRSPRARPTSEPTARPRARPPPAPPALAARAPRPAPPPRALAAPRGDVTTAGCQSRCRPAARSRPVAEPPDPAPLPARLLTTGGPGRPLQGAPSHGYPRTTPRRAAPPSSPLPRRPERPRYRPRKLRGALPSGRAAPRRLRFVRAERPAAAARSRARLEEARPPPPAGGRAGSRRSGGPHPRAAAAEAGGAGRPPPSGREPRPGTCGLRWLRLPPLPAPQARARAAANGNGRGGGVRAHRARRDAARRCAPQPAPPRPARARLSASPPRDNQWQRPAAGAAGNGRYKSPGAIYAARGGCARMRAARAGPSRNGRGRRSAELARPIPSGVRCLCYSVLLEPPLPSFSISSALLVGSGLLSASALPRSTVCGRCFLPGFQPSVRQCLEHLWPLHCRLLLTLPFIFTNIYLPIIYL